MISYLIGHQMNMILDCVHCMWQEDDLEGVAVLLYANKQVKKQPIFILVTVLKLV
jgi:hypothetical protein